MPLRNRVDPFGAIVASGARGLFTGNRGAIHDPGTRTLTTRRWTTRAWIVCDLVHPHGVTREPMGSNAPSGGAGWTELFFLDEVTALAAGHRPCFYCRRGAAVHFRLCLASGNGMAGPPSAPAMDAILHRQRLASGGQPRPVADAAIRALPDGAVIAFGGRAFAVRGGALLPWSFGGYAAPPPACRSLPDRAVLLTPPATVAALEAGYEPLWHPSAG